MVRHGREVEMEVLDRVFRPQHFNGQNLEARLWKMKLYMMAMGVPDHCKLFWMLACFEDDYLNWYNYSPGPAAPKTGTD